MIFGYSTNAFVKFSLDESLEKIAALGFRGVEIMGDRPHLYPPDFEAEDLARIKKNLKKLNLKVTNLNSFTLFAVGDTYLPSWIEPEKERRDIRIQHTLDCLKTARELDCNNISIPPGGPLNNLSRKDAMRLFHKGLEQVIPLAEELDVKILVEPEPDLLMENTKEFKPFIEDIQSQMVGLNFDIGHFFCAGEDPAEAFEELFEYVGHVHLEDIAETRVHHHLIAGHGAIRFLDIFKTMATLKYQGDISLELYPYTDTPESAGQKSLEYLRPIFKKSGLNIAR
ncbi:MAG: sugar phosphate isomerase/epimerase [Deltaproteobacteria bacterium]|jgi:sugar phosphate isomerase/epimerase|nr:sugar phosphate isomerase/epimerase [Deltaproteobacteria bacterium]